MKIADCCICCGSTQLTKTPALLMPFVAARVFDWQPVRVLESWGLSTIPTGTMYPVCNSVECQECSVIFCDMRFDDDELRRLYAGYRGADYTALREEYEPGYTKRNQALLQENHIAQVEAFLGMTPRTILDFGGGDGSKAPYQSAVRDVYDIDTQFGYDAAVLRDDYDLIVCAHVLEHVSYPLHTLDILKTFMHDNSVLYIELPDDLSQTPLYELPRKYWHEHINLFSGYSIQCMLQREGLQIIKQQRKQIGGRLVYMLACKRMANV